MAFGCGAGDDEVRRALATLIDVSGGGNFDDELGGGGAGGEVRLSVRYDGGASIEVLESGEVDPAITPTEGVVVDLGPAPLEVPSDLTVVLDPPADVAIETIYALTDDGWLYESDGNGELGDDNPASGLRVHAGATLVLPLNFVGGTFANFGFVHDIVNDGDITVPDVDDGLRGNLFLGTLSPLGRYIGSGRLLTHARIAGQTGGHIAVTAQGGIYNEGDCLSYGGDSDIGHGGRGGAITFHSLNSAPYGHVENHGRLVAHGGDGLAIGFGAGGTGGFVSLVGGVEMWNSGDIEIEGGAGAQLGGAGGAVQLYANAGEVRNEGDIHAAGGGAQEMVGGMGGIIDVTATGGPIRSHGRFEVQGGDSRGLIARGGMGGRISLTVEADLDPPAISARDIEASGAMVARGGIGERLGGAGGTFHAVIMNDPADGAQTIRLLGFEGIDASGSSARDIGGEGGLVVLDHATGETLTTSTITVEPPIDASGGDADEGRPDSVGGDSGCVYLSAAEIFVQEIWTVGGTGGLEDGADGRDVCR